MPVLPSLPGAGDHGALSGLTDDDHTGYLKADGTRTLSGNLTITGTVDGRDVAADGTKLDGIATGAQANADLASQGEAEAGVENTKTMTALRVAQAIASLAGGSLLNKFDATTAPTSTDDTGSGYSIGSVWIDVTANEAYRCVDATNSAAIWINTTLDSSELATVAISGDSDDLTQGSSNLLMTTSERTKLAGIASDAEANPDVVSQAEAEAGLSNAERIWTPLRVKQAFDSFGGGGYTGTTDGAIPFVHTDKTLTENADYASIENANGRTTLQALSGTISEETDAATVNFNLATANYFSVTINGNRTFTVSNSKVGQEFKVRVEQGAGGNRLVTWWATINWPGGSAPVLTTTAAKADWFTFVVRATNTYDCICRTFDLGTEEGVY